MTETLTAAQMRDLVVLGDRETLCAKLDTLDEKRRQSLAKEAIAIASAINEGWGPSGIQEERIGEDPDGSRRALLQELGEQEYVDWRVPRWTANLLVAGLCDKAVFLKPWDFGLFWLRQDLADMPERLLQILLARRPKWLAGWLEKEWKQEPPIPNGYVEGGLIQAGLIDAQPGEAYLNRLGDDTMERFPSAASKTDKFRGQRRTVKQKIESDPELWGRRIWSIFEYDSTITRYSFKPWGNALRELSLEGKIDRQDLLQRSLTGMCLPFSPLTLTGMGKLHQLLAPTIEEQEQLQTDYLRLLAASESSVVSLALATCDELLKAKRLDGIAFFDALPAVFRIDKKTPPMKALSVTKKLIKQDRELETHAAVAVAEGLQHVNTDVQEACLKFLISLPSPISSKARSIVANFREWVAPSLQSQIDPLLEMDAAVPDNSEAASDSKQTAAATSTSAAGTESVRTSTNPNHESDESGSISGLQKRAARLPKSIQFTAGISAALEQLQSGGPLTIAPVRPHEIPRRDPSRQVAPVESVEELIELVATTIESIRDVMELERILDGISRFRAERPAKFEQRTAPLKKRIVKLSEPYTGKFLDQAMNIGLTQLLMTWLDMPVADNSRAVHWTSMRGWFLRERISYVTECIVSSRNKDWPKHQVPMPLLSLPTHTSGWIDPVILVQRINEHYVKHRELTDCYDLAQALLRLMPDGREDALTLLDKPDHYNGGHMLRHALGDSCELKSFGGWGSEAALVAAVRARQTVEPDATSAYPIANASYRADQSIAVEGALTEDPTVPFSLAEVALSIEPFFTRVIGPDHRSSWLETWESLTNPSETEASCMAGHLGHLLDPETTWSYAACRLFVVAASDDRAENRVFATDGLLEGIARSLVSPQWLGKAFADTFSFIKLNRVSKVLGETCVESNLHRWVVAEAIEHTLSLLDELPKDIHLLLSLLLEAKTSLGLSVSEPAAKKLAGVSGSSKAGKLAKQLLSLSTTEARYDELNAALFTTLLERGERWRDLSGLGKP